MEPATSIIMKCGGVAVVSGWVGKAPATVHRWKYPRARGGTGGRIPEDDRQTILARAREAGIALTYDDFNPHADRAA